MAFPFLFLASSFAFGIWLADLTGLPIIPAVLALAGTLGLAWVLHVRARNSLALAAVLAAAVCLGAGTYAVRTDRYEHNRLHLLTETTYADFIGTLSQTPSPGLDRDYLTLRVETVVLRNKERRIEGNLRVSVPRSAGFPKTLDFASGDRLKVAAQIVSLREYRNFREPFSRMYLKAQFLHNLAATKSPLLIERLASGPKLSPFRLVSALRLRFQRKIERDFAAGADPAQLTPEGAVLETLLLGGRGRLAPETMSALQKTGLYHLFAISGAHIGLISLLIFGLLRFARVPLRLSYGVLIVLLLLYAALVEGRASVLRAVIMSVAFLAGKLFWKDAHLLNTIGFSAFAILSVNPFQLFDLGFQLTFAATLAILVFMPKILALLPKLPLKIGETFAMSVAAQAGVMPLIALSFNRIIFSGLLLNFIGIPLVGLIMAAGYLYLPVALLSPTLSGPMAAGLAFLIKAFMASTHLLDRFAFFSYRIPTPPVLVIAGYFLGLLLLGMPSRSRKIRIAEAAGFGLFFAALILYPFPSGSRDLKITFIDVGQGDSILLQFPGRRTMLVDGGGLPFGTFDVGESVVSPFLWSKGLKSIDTLVLTHGHPDHLYGLPAVAANFRIGEYWEAFSPPAESKYTDLRAALGTRVRLRRVFRGFSVWEGDVRIDALSPRETQPILATADNDRSLVLRITYGSTAFLLAADVGINAEDDILADSPDVRSHVLKSPHHGSLSSSSDPFLTAVAAKFIVISSGAGNRAGLPHPAILDRYRKTGAHILRTDLDGAIEISSDGTAVAVRTAVKERAFAAEVKGRAFGSPLARGLKSTGEYCGNGPPGKPGATAAAGNH